jgi:hypothetical protein
MENPLVRTSCPHRARNLRLQIKVQQSLSVFETSGGGKTLLRGQARLNVRKVTLRATAYNRTHSGSWAGFTMARFVMATATRLSY